MLHSFHGTRETGLRRSADSPPPVASLTHSAGSEASGSGSILYTPAGHHSFTHLASNTLLAADRQPVDKFRVATTEDAISLSSSDGDDKDKEVFFAIWNSQRGDETLASQLVPASVRDLTKYRITQITGAVQLKIEMCVLAPTSLSVTVSERWAGSKRLRTSDLSGFTLYGHETAFAQCREFLDNFHNLTLISCEGGAGGAYSKCMEAAKERPGRKVAVIGPRYLEREVKFGKVTTICEQIQTADSQTLFIRAKTERIPEGFQLRLGQAQTVLSNIVMQISAQLFIHSQPAECEAFLKKRGYDPSVLVGFISKPRATLDCTDKGFKHALWRIYFNALGEAHMTGLSKTERPVLLNLYDLSRSAPVGTGYPASATPTSTTSPPPVVEAMEVEPNPSLFRKPFRF